MKERGPDLPYFLEHLKSSVSMHLMSGQILEVFKILETKTDRTGRRKRQIHSYNPRFDIPLIINDKTISQKISEGLEDANSIINQFDLTDMPHSPG